MVPSIYLDCAQQLAQQCQILRNRTEWTRIKSGLTIKMEIAYAAMNTISDASEAFLTR